VSEDPPFEPRGDEESELESEGGKECRSEVSELEVGS